MIAPNHRYRMLIFNTRPSAKTTFPSVFPENPTVAPFFAGACLTVIWSPGCKEVLVQSFLRMMPGLWLSMAQLTSLLLVIAERP